MPRINSITRSNSSGVPGLRLNSRRGRRVIDVTWNAETGVRCSTSYLLTTAGPLHAVAMAMGRREAATGVPYEISPRQAWERLKRSEQACGGSGR